MILSTLQHWAVVFNLPLFSGTLLDGRNATYAQREEDSMLPSKALSYLRYLFATHSNSCSFILPTHQSFTYSKNNKSTRILKGIMLRVNNDNTSMTSNEVILVSLLLPLNIFTPCLSVLIVYIGHVKSGLAVTSYSS